jgi:transcriptional regulator with XRE-family HTH domain
MNPHPLKAWLASEKLTEAELSRRSGVPRADLSRVLNGRRPRFSVAAALKLSKLTAIPLEDLLKAREPESPPRPYRRSRARKSR